MADNGWKLTAAALIFLFAATFGVFRGALSNPFHFDDHLFLQSPQVAEPGDPWYLLKPTQTRPFTYLTFYWNYRAGATSPVGYHAVNLFLHLANTWAVFFFATLIVRRNAETILPIVRRWLPVASAAVFALHPIQSEPVNYIYQRSVLLAALFSLLALICCLRPNTLPSLRLRWICAVVLFILAAGSKESALALPLIWPALLWSESRSPEHFGQQMKEIPWLRAIILLTASLGGWGLYLLYRQGERPAGLALTRQALQYMMNQIQVFATYLRLILWPSGLSIEHDFYPAPFLSLYAFACYLLCLAIILAVLYSRGRNPVLAFLVLAFVVLLLPTSSVLPSKDLMFEHRLYLPMIAGSVALAWLILQAAAWIARTGRGQSAACLLSMGLVLGAYSLVSRERTWVWGDNIRLWEDAAAKAPRKPRAHYNLAVACLERDPVIARKEFLATLDLEPGHAAALYNLGWLDQREGAYESARNYYTAALSADPSRWEAHQNLANLAVIQGRPDDAAREFQACIRLRPTYWPAFQSLAGVQLRSGDARGALNTLHKLDELQPSLLESRYLKAYALTQEKRLPEAETEIRIISAQDKDGQYRERIKALLQFISREAHSNDHDAAGGRDQR